LYSSENLLSAEVSPGRRLSLTRKRKQLHQGIAPFSSAVDLGYGCGNPNINHD
jgi:hypothetical protein